MFAGVRSWETTQSKPSLKEAVIAPEPELAKDAEVPVTTAVKETDTFPDDGNIPFTEVTNWEVLAVVKIFWPLIVPEVPISMVWKLAPLDAVIFPIMFTF